MIPQSDPQSSGVSLGRRAHLPRLPNDSSMIRRSPCMAVEGSMMVVTPVRKEHERAESEDLGSRRPFCLETKDLKCHTSVIRIVRIPGDGDQRFRAIVIAIPG
jgi:hypothetical protein